ncbi:cyclic nucleotide-binding/CBS domain-containing protein [Haliscomenobacter hydrossis]|uniref:CBS domain containing protein n=1 Tax=Haliscomenobacter hydrossis (strain ATCC 27775 / DSM 1100 / LMG 10767 / O) TaxID=760192 RepID=F4L6D9_HALH1|nr:CBS domain-containing protein [Haliscomenobacter hydrossis]AEE48821.1 CBS domain containing protein [Haliscomenobacter hydrossis DSM 1100]
MKTIKQLMSSLVVVANAQSTFDNLMQLMTQYNISAIPITHEGAKQAIIGIVTELDLRNWKDTNLTAMSLMSTRLCYINGDDSAANAANLMLKNRIHHLLVKDKKHDTLIGILSSVDLLKLVASQSFTAQPILFFV